MKIDNIIENAVKAVINEYTDSDFSGAKLISDVMANKPDSEDMEFIIKYFPNAVKSMSTAQGNLKASDASPMKKRMGRYAPMFIHVQYNKFEDDANQVFAVHQKQYYNSNFKDKPGGEKFNPQVTKLAFMGGDDQKDNMGEILVVTDEYIKDLSKLRSQGKLDKTVSESVNEAKFNYIQDSDEVRDIFKKITGKSGYDDLDSNMFSSGGASDDGDGEGWVLNVDDTNISTREKSMFVDAVMKLGKKKGWNIKQYGDDAIEIYESVNEANRGKVYRAAKQGSYPAVIVVIQDGKVIHQEPVSTPDVAPAAFNVMQEKYPKAVLHLEDNTGKRLFSESVNEAVKEVVLSNEILDFLEERGIVKGSDAQKVHKDLTAFLKKKLNESVVAESFADPLEEFPQAYKDLLKKLQRSNDRGERSMLINKMNVIRKKLKLKPLTNESLKESIKEGAMSDIHMLAQEASTIEEFIKEFMADYGDKFAGASKPKLDKWLADLYTDAKAMKESKLNENRGQDEATDLILKLERNLYTKLSDLELDAFKKEMAQHFGSAMNESTTNSKTESIAKRLREDTEYQEFFKSTMHKFGVKSPKELKGKKKDEFFNYIDKNYKAKSESTLNEDFFKTHSSDNSTTRKTTTQLNNTFKALQSQYKVPTRVLEIAVGLINELVDQGWEEGRLDVEKLL